MKYLLSLIFILMISCDGTLGSFNGRKFTTPKKNIEKAIDTLFAKNPEYKIPENWKIYDNWKKAGYDFLDTRIFYLQSEPKEMYYVSFIGNGNEKQNENGPTILAIRAVNFGNYSWSNYEEFTKKERERIEQRFDNEIISKIEKYSGVKATRKNNYR